MSAKPTKNRGLGRGLSALMSDVPAASQEGDTVAPRPDLVVPIESVIPNPDQPRRSFDEQALEDLTASVREKGIIQPLIVRRAPNAVDKYEIVAGERRWRAAQRAQLHDIPVLVREFDDTEVLEVAIIENIQRSDLNPVDEAAGYRRLMDTFGHTQDQLAQALGKSRSHIANQMRLLSLPESVLSLLTSGKLSSGHARTLVGHPKAEALAADIVKRSLSVREAERLAKADISDAQKKTRRISSEKDADTIQIERDLSAQLKMKVSIDQKSGSESGRLTLGYKNLDQLDDLLRLLSGT